MLSYQTAFNVNVFAIIAPIILLFSGLLVTMKVLGKFEGRYISDKGWFAYICSFLFMTFIGIALLAFCKTVSSSGEVLAFVANFTC